MRCIDYGKQLIDRRVTSAPTEPIPDMPAHDLKADAISLLTSLECQLPGLIAAGEAPDLVDDLGQVVERLRTLLLAATSD